MNWTAEESQAGMRLDKFLTERLSGSRSQIKKQIKAGSVLVNGKASSVHFFLKSGDVVTLTDTTATPIVQAAAVRPLLTPAVIFEDANFIVLDKPAGMLVHTTEQGEVDTLADWLKIHCPEIESVGEHKYRAGILHRLDREVSGVLVAAKTNQAFLHLKQQFKEREIKKEYTALVYGKVERNGEITLPIGRSKDGKFVAHPRRGREKFLVNDRVAITRYQVVELIRDYSLLHVQILTGRTHQIRAHLAAVGHPILGDQLYGPKKTIFHLLRRRVKVVDPGRIFLHSSNLSFRNLDGEWATYAAPLPKSLTDYLNALRIN